MRKERLVAKLRSLEGRRVSLAMADGSRIDDCQLVCAGRRQLRQLWLFANGEDAFVALDDVLDVWEMAPVACSRVA
jgi:hypothetical protein